MAICGRADRLQGTHASSISTCIVWISMYLSAPFSTCGGVHVVALARAPPKLTPANDASAGFEFAGVVNVPRSAPVVAAEKRGYHFVFAVASAPQHSVSSPVVTPSTVNVWGVGICGEVTSFGWDLQNKSGKVLFNKQDLIGLQNGRTIIPFDIPEIETSIVVGFRGFLLYNISDPSMPILLSNVSLPYNPSHSHVEAEVDSGNGDAGINGIVQLVNTSTHFGGSSNPDEAGGKILIGAFMPGQLHVVRASLDSRQLEPVGVVNLSINGGSFPSVFDVAHYQAPDGSQYLVTVSGRVSRVGFLAVVRIAFPHQPLLPHHEWKAVGVLDADQTWTGCNRVRVHHGYAFFSCYGNNVVGFVDLSNPTHPRLQTTQPNADIQPTGMMVVGNALVVAGGRQVMAFNISTPSDPHVVAVCGVDVCGQILVTEGQNAHSMSHYAPTNPSNDHYIFLSAQMDNNVGAIKVVNPDLIALMNEV